MPSLQQAPHAMNTATPVPWSAAVSATLHCLTGCAIGEVLGMVIGTAAGWPAWATVALAVGLAFFFGYALTVRGVLRAGLGLRRAVRIALLADTVSIAVMEIVDNAVMLTVPGAMEAGATSWGFWASLAFALAVAFVVTLPLNRAMMSRTASDPGHRTEAGVARWAPADRGGGRVTASAAGELPARRDGQQLVAHRGAGAARDGRLEVAAGPGGLPPLAPAGRHAAHGGAPLRK